MIKTPVAVISDIHGNLRALEAVLEDIERRNIKKIVNLGDSLYGPLEPAETASLLMLYDIISVRGNEDRILIEHDEAGVEHAPSTQFTRECLSNEHLEWLRELKPVETFEGILLFHGIPDDDMTYLVHKVTETGMKIRDDEEISSMLKLFDNLVICCGHDHLPNTIPLEDSRIIINPGSVGLPAYRDEEPFPHKVENRSPHSRYSIIWEDLTVEQVALQYDFRSAAETAKKNSRVDWVRWLTLGSA